MKLVVAEKKPIYYKCCSRSIENMIEDQQYYYSGSIYRAFD